MESWTSLQTRYLGGANRPRLQSRVSLLSVYSKTAHQRSEPSRRRGVRFVNGHITWGYLIMKLRSNTILITGGASGIGYELTKQLTALGNTILITGRDQAKMARAKAAFPKLHTFRSDVSDPKAIVALYEEVTKQCPEVNILINNAGIMPEINVHDKAGSLEDITREIEINLSGQIPMVKHCSLHLKTKSHAAIMSVSSGLEFVPLPMSPVKAATMS